MDDSTKAITDDNRLTVDDLNHEDVSTIHSDSSHLDNKKNDDNGQLTDMDDGYIGDEDDEEEEEAEPRLLYERIKYEVSVIAQKDAISSFCVNSRILVVGTHLGRIYILDHQGNKVHRDIVLSNNSSVTQVSADLKGEFIASCTENRVYIHGLLSAECNLVLNFDRPVRAVAIDPYFSTKGSDRRIITGDDKVNIHSKNFFSKYVKTVLHQGDGIIRSIKWNGNLVAWSTDINVRIYDLSFKSLIAVIKRDHDIRLRPEIYRCCLTWKGPTTLLIGWADSIKICEVRDKRNTLAQSSPSSADLPDKFVEVTNMFNSNFCISGIAPLAPDQLILLVVEKDELERSGSTPQMMIIQPLKSFDYIELSSDLLSPKGFQAYQCCDYHLEPLIEDELYFIVCPKDIIIAKPRSDDDHVTWLLDRQRYTEALEAIKNSQKVTKFSYSEVGMKYIIILVDRSEGTKEDELKEAAALSVSVCGKNRDLWNQVFKLFDSTENLSYLTEHLPIDPSFALDNSHYEAVLKSHITKDSEKFLKLINTWPPSLYRSKVVIHDVMDALQFDSHNELLLRGLAKIYTNEHKHDKALEIYLKIGDHNQVFALIRKFDLYDTLRDGLDYLMLLNPEESSRLLVEHQDKISTEFVVSKLKNRPTLLWVYLDQVIKRDPDSHPEYHQKLVELYAEHAQDRLLPFLKSSNLYSLEKALHICQNRNYIHEMVFLLARMGNTKQALQCMMRLNNIEAAIEFCKEQDDKELWDQMIALSKENPSFMRALLSNVGTYIPDPVSLISKVPEETQIEGLKDALVKILEEYKIQISLEERSKRILVHDNFTLFSKLIAQRTKPLVVSENSICSACRRPILASGFTSHSIQLFNCKHLFHGDCLESASCVLCSSSDASTLTFQ